MERNEDLQITTFNDLSLDIRTGKDNQTIEIVRRIGPAWIAFRRLGHILKSNISIFLKRNVSYQCVVPVLTCCAETLTLIVRVSTRKTANEWRVTERAMKRVMLSITLKDRIPNDEIR